MTKQEALETVGIPQLSEWIVGMGVEYPVAIVVIVAVIIIREWNG